MANFPKQFRPGYMDVPKPKTNTQETQPEYHTQRWRKHTRLPQLEREPLCRLCKAEDRITPATVCDHIIQVTVLMAQGKSFWEASQPEHLQSLCDNCHNIKRANERNQK